MRTILTRLFSFFALPAVMLFFNSATAQDTLQTTPPKADYVQYPDDDAVSANDLQTPPKFPGGIKALYTYIVHNYILPNNVSFGTTVRILVKFVVEKDGSMSDFEVIKDPGNGFGEEAVRVLQSIQEKWEPGIQNGTVVRTSFSLPITFNIPEDRKQKRHKKH